VSARNIVGGLAGAAVGAVKHPVGTAGEAISKAKGVVSAGTAVGTAVAGSVVGKVRGGAGEPENKAAGTAPETQDETADAEAAPKDPASAAKDTVDRAADAVKTTTDKAAEATKTSTDKAAKAAKAGTDKAAEAAKATTDVAAETAKSGADAAAGVAAGAAATAKKAAKKAPASKKAPAKKAAKKAAPKREPQVVLAEPAVPLQPPIDVVGQALAAEAQEDHLIGAGRSTEPRGASRDEEHGDAALQRAEAAEIMEEIAEASNLGNIDIETPVGTTGADVGNNPDTAEADLQQPGTEPLLDPSLTKAIKSEQETLRHAADTDKG
jgi:hypothetical protein